LFVAAGAALIGWGALPPPAPPPVADAPPPRARVAGAALEDGTEIDCDLPASLHVRNRGGSDGSGLCVFASMRHSGLWSDEPVFAALFQWMWTRPGGGYPQKVDRMVERYWHMEKKE